MSKEVSRSLKTFAFGRQTVSPFAPSKHIITLEQLDLVELGLMFTPLVTLSVQFHLDGSHSHKNLSMLYVPATLRSEVNWEGAYCAHTEIRLKAVTWYTVEPVFSGTELSGHTLWWPLNIGLTVWRSIVFHFCLMFVVFLKSVGILVNYKIIHKIKNEPLYIYICMNIHTY